MSEAGWLKRFIAHGLSGAYLSIESPGSVRAGDQIEVLSRPDHGLDMPTVFRAYHDDVDALRKVIDSGALTSAEQLAWLRDRFAQLLERRDVDES